MTRRTRRGKRSLDRQQRRYVNHLVRSSSHEDLIMKEAINVLTPEEIQEALNTKFNYVHTASTQLFERGEILADPRGEGSLQRRIDDENDEEHPTKWRIAQNRR